MFFQLIPFVLFAASTVAFPALHHSSARSLQQDTHPFLGVPSDGVRSPCPAHNTLANHGYIPRNGRGISKQMIEDAVSQVFNIGPETIGPIADRALAICSFITQSVCEHYDLNHLTSPHAIEHDGSLSRNDFMMQWNDHADNVSFNQTVFDRTLAVWGDATHINIQLGNAARVTRLNQAREEDLPGAFIQNDDVTTTEMAFILFAMNDHTVNADLSKPLARKDWIQYWFENERLPTELGFTPQLFFPGDAYISSLANAVRTAPIPTRIATAPAVNPAASATTVAHSTSSITSSRFVPEPTSTTTTSIAQFTSVTSSHLIPAPLSTTTTRVAQFTTSVTFSHPISVPTQPTTATAR